MSESTSHPTLFLIDGSAYLFRAFHALPPLTNSAGEPTGALLGVGNMLRRLLNEYNVEYAAFVYDASGKTFRNDLYDQYKANRPPMPDELRAQRDPLLDIVKAMGFPVLEVKGVEADDVIGTLATQASKQGMKVVVSSSDKDLAQLVDENVVLVNTMTDTTLDIDGVRSKFGVGPEKIIDYLALIGDKVDNVPGVNKVGPKTATKWLDQYDDLDGIIANADQFKGKIGEYLREALEQLPLSRELVTIKLDVELDQGPADLKLAEPDQDKLSELVHRYEFTSWQDELPAPADAALPQPVEAHYEVIYDQSQLDEWLKRLRDAGTFALDCETDSTDPMRASLVGLSFASEPGCAAYLPLAHCYPGAPVQLDREAVLRQFAPLLADNSLKIVGQHFKYDLIVLARHGVEVNNWADDTMLESYVFNSTASRHDMDSLAKTYLNRTTIKYEEVAGKGAKQITFDQVPLDTAAPYAAEDADVTLQLHHQLSERLSEEARPEAIYRDIEMPLAPVLAAVERTGVLVDADQLKQLSQEFAKRMAAIEQEAYDLAGREFSLASPKQLQQILFEEQGLPVIRKTPKGQPSTAEDVLEQLAADFPLPKMIIEHRGLSKLKSTYTDKLPQDINPETGRIHTSYHQAVAATGRLSSADPNLQNIPIRTAEGRRIRQAFVAPEGYTILAADYSQIELRIMAHLSGDEGLLTAFQQGKDIHAATAAEVFGGTPDTVDAEHRRAAKAINFGLMYGMSAFGLARNLGIERGTAAEYIETYFARYPGVKDFMETTREQARQQGYVETVFGRRLYLKEINSRNFQRRQASERAAINAPMQGTAADIIKRAMIDVYGWLSGELADDARMIMQVHDELVLEVRTEQIESVSVGIADRMAAAAELNVPLVVDVGTGTNWDEAH